MNLPSVLGRIEAAFIPCGAQAVPPFWPKAEAARIKETTRCEIMIMELEDVGGRKWWPAGSIYIILNDVGCGARKEA
jgi:hypothetical protein